MQTVEHYPEGSRRQLTEFIAVSYDKYEQSTDAQVGNELTDRSEEESRLVATINHA